MRSRKVKGSGYLSVFVFCRHAKLSQCFFFGVAKLLKENHYTQGYVYEWGDFFYFRVSFPKKGRPLLGRSPHQGVRGCVIIGHHSAFDGYTLKINPIDAHFLN